VGTFLLVGGPSQACEQRPLCDEGVAAEVLASERVRLLTRNWTDWTLRFPNIVRAIAALPCRSCMIDGEVVACDETGVPVFKLLRRHAPAALYAFDLLELDGLPLRFDAIESRKAALAALVGEDRPGLMLSQPIEVPTDKAFAHICKLGLEGIVSKRLGTSYEPGRSLRWLKTLNPDAPSRIRLLEEDWNR
jgi:bifunctional non-homologous end joining protein LigD